jgi:type IV secretory pathway TrbF-like protein
MTWIETLWVREHPIEVALVALLALLLAGVIIGGLVWQLHHSDTDEEV